MPLKGFKYCFLYKQGCSGIYHRARPDGLPACGTRVDTCALEATDDEPPGCDKCKRCFKTIPVVFVEDSHEPCAFCEKMTTHWTALKNRTPGEQVAVCSICADKRAPKDVPSKEAWCEYHRTKLKSRVYVTTGDCYYGWPEYYSFADTSVELKQTVEDLMREGYGVNDILFWEEFALPEGEPERGIYLVVHYDQDYPEEPFDVHLHPLPCANPIVLPLKLCRRQLHELRKYLPRDRRIETEVRVVSVKRSNS